MAHQQQLVIGHLWFGLFHVVLAHVLAIVGMASHTCTSIETDTSSLIQRHVSIPRDSIDRAPTLPSDSVFVVFPGVGHSARVQNVVRNIHILKSTLGQQFKCFLRIYIAGAATNPQYAASLFEPCQVDYSQKGGLMASLKAINVPAHEVNSVFFMTDDMPLKNKTLRMLMTVLSKPGMDVASASYPEAWCGNMKPRKGIIAHKSNFVEFNAALFRTPAFLCLQEIIDAKLNPLGLGYDNMFASLCKVQMAVCDACVISHISENEAQSASPNRKISFDHALGLDQMKKWFRSLEMQFNRTINLLGFDQCDWRPSPTLLIDTSTEDLRLWEDTGPEIHDYGKIPYRYMHP